MRLAALVLAAAAVVGAQPKPRLAISIEQAITRPGRNGKGALIRPLVLIVSNWQSKTPEVEAYSYAGTVEAECAPLPSPAGQWNADVKFSMTEEPGNDPFPGHVRLRLKVDGSIVRGEYEGAFNGIAMSGRPGAGLVFEHMYQPPHRGLLLWLPHLKNPVKGILIWGNGAALDDRHAALREDMQAFAAANSLALIGTGELSAHTMGAGEGQAILDGLKSLGAMSGHPELERAPIFFMGHSNGGGMAIAFNDWLRSRVAAYVDSHGSPVLNGLSSDRAVANPGILTAGEVDPKIPPRFIAQVFQSIRGQGARVCFLVEQGENHPPGAGSMPFFLFFLQHVAEHRPGPAWLADNSTWKQGITQIMPAAGFGGDASVMSWLPDQDVAFIYRGIATYDNPLKLERTGSHGPAYLRKEPVEIQATAFGDGPWKSIALYDGAARLGEMAPDRPKLVLRDQMPGAHAGVLIGELLNGDLRTSLPVSWVVWP